MVRQFLITLTPTDLTFPTAPQAELPPGVAIDSWTVVNNGDVAVALAFGQVRRDAAGGAIDDLTVAPNGVGPTSAFSVDAEDRKIWLRCVAASGSAFTVQLNAVLNTRSGASQPSGGSGSGAVAGLATHAAQIDGTQKTQIVQGGNTALVTGAGALKVDTGAAGPLALEATQLLVKGQQTDGTQRTKITDGVNNAAVGNSAPAGTEHGLLVRPVFAPPTVAPRTYFTLVALTFTQIATANAAVKGRVIYNNGASTVYIGLGATAINGANPAATSTFPLAPGQFYEFFPAAGGLARWLGDVYAMATGAGQITVTEIS